MVVLLDLDEDDINTHRVHSETALLAFSKPYREEFNPAQKHDAANQDNDDRPNPNINSFSAALACYPIVVQITRSLDLNSLHALSRTCRQFRSSLLQYHRQLVNGTLRCIYEPCSIRKAHESGHSNRRQVPSANVLGMGFLTSGKIGTCARDMVGECRRCDEVVCRNCTMKAPSKSSLIHRHRRLCSICLAAAIELLIDPFTICTNPPSFTSSAFADGLCTCPDLFYICQPCGHALANSDTAYKRIWTWRTRYSTYLGGLGTGIGEGNEGVKCGRGDHCLAAKDIEMEIDSAADGLSSLVWVDAFRGESTVEESWIDTGEKAGYLTQEMEGIGGVVKKKVKKRVKVGRTVREYEDEREKAEYLGREMRMENRSWCGWCDRVILGKKDLERKVLRDSNCLRSLEHSP